MWKDRRWPGRVLLQAHLQICTLPPAVLQCCRGLLGLALITTPIFIHLTFTRICEVQSIIKIITVWQFSLLHFVILVEGTKF